MIRILYIIIPFLLFGSTALATEYGTGSFRIYNPIISEGGAVKIKSLSFFQRSTIGGVRAIGTSSSTHFQVKSGFQYYDETAPYIDEVIINDGEDADIDEQVSLNSICANWHGFKDPESGIHLLYPYEYAVRQASNDYFWNEIISMWQEEESWSSSTSTSICVSGVGLQTSATYYFSVRARNNIKLVSWPVNSDGVKVIPKLEFALDSILVDLGELDPSNNYTSTAQTQITVSTNAYHGYKISAWSARPLTHTLFPMLEIEDFYGTNEIPQEWSGTCEDSPNYCGFGYSTDDLTLDDGAVDRFDGRFAGWTHNEQKKIIADYEADITGLAGEAINETTTITYKVSTDENLLNGDYNTTIIYVVTPNY